VSVRDVHTIDGKRSAMFRRNLRAGIKIRDQPINTRNLARWLSGKLLLKLLPPRVKAKMLQIRYPFVSLSVCPLSLRWSLTLSPRINQSSNWLAAIWWFVHRESSGNHQRKQQQLLRAPPVAGINVQYQTAYYFSIPVLLFNFNALRDARARYIYTRCRWQYLLPVFHKDTHELVLCARCCTMRCLSDVLWHRQEWKVRTTCLLTCVVRFAYSFDSNVVPLLQPA